MVISFFVGLMLGAAAALFTLEEQPAWVRDLVPERFLRSAQLLGSFAQGRLLINQGRYRDGIQLLEEYLAKHPRGRNAGRARFFLGKAYIGLDLFDRAAEEFRAAVFDFPETDEAQKSRYKLAQIDLWQGREDEAQHAFRELAQNPAGPLTPEAAAMSRYLSRRLE